ncbi:hypothetical protein ACSQ67_018427 [Phaseolus vulgaris]
MLGRLRRHGRGVGGGSVYNGSAAGASALAKKRVRPRKEIGTAEPGHPERPASQPRRRSPGAYGKPDGGRRARESDDVTIPRLKKDVTEATQATKMSTEKVERLKVRVGREADGLKSARGTHEEPRGATERRSRPGGGFKSGSG